MKKYDVFTFTAPNGVKVAGVVIDVVRYKEENQYDGSYQDLYLCYAQNRIFYYHHFYGHSKSFIGFDGEESHYEEKDLDEWSVGETLANYATLPEYDDMLEETQRDLDMEKFGTMRPWEEEFEREIQGCNDK